MEAIELNSIPNHNKQVVAQAVNEEVVLILPTQGKVKVLNEAGSRIWEWIDGHSSVEQIAHQLHQEFDVDLEQAKDDVLAFLQEMRKKDLIDVNGE